jgi:hypothetical protein
MEEKKGVQPDQRVALDWQWPGHGGHGWGAVQDSGDAPLMSGSCDIVTGGEGGR